MTDRQVYWFAVAVVCIFTLAGGCVIGGMWT